MRRRETAAAVLAIAIAASLLSFRPIYEPDLWWHLAQGREDAAGRLVRTNLFSFTTPEYRQHYTPWLFDVAVYASWTIARGAGIQVLQSLLLALTLALLAVACRIRASVSGAAVVLLVWITGSSFSTCCHSNVFLLP